MAVADLISDVQIDSDDLAHWTIDAKGPNWQVATRYDFLRREQMIRANMAEPLSRQISRALGWMLNYLFTGTLFRVYRASHQYGLALTAFQMMLVCCLCLRLGWRLTAWLTMRLIDGRSRSERSSAWSRRSSASGCCFRWQTSCSSCRSIAIALSVGICRGEPSCWDRCIEGGAHRLVDIAKANAADEIVVVGHSGGGVTARPCCASTGTRPRARPSRAVRLCC